MAERLRPRRDAEHASVSACKPIPAFGQGRLVHIAEPRCPEKNRHSWQYGTAIAEFRCTGRKAHCRLKG